MSDRIEKREMIAAKLRAIQEIEQEIILIAKSAIPEFHFLNHQVSKFWNCDKSPVGVCVWDISDRGFHIDCSCHYCGEPVERK